MKNQTMFIALVVLVAPKEWDLPFRSCQLCRKKYGIMVNGVHREEKTAEIQI